jgi:alanine racemase
MLRQRIGKDVILGVVVKGEAFGHGLLLCAKEFVTASVDWLIVNSAHEAIALRQAGVTTPIYICGNVSTSQAYMVTAAQARVVLYDVEVAKALAKAGYEKLYHVRSIDRDTIDS